MAANKHECQYGSSSLLDIMMISIHDILCKGQAMIFQKYAIDKMNIYNWDVYIHVNTTN